MSDSNYFNRKERRLFSNLGTQQNTTFSDVFLSVPLLNSLVVATNVSASPVRVLYPEAVDNGFFSINSLGEIVISKAGLYTVTGTGSFDSFDGICQNYVELIINNTPYIVDIKNQPNGGSSANNSNTVVGSSTTVALKVGDRVAHFVAGITGAVPNFTLIGTNQSTLFTSATLIYLSQP